ncbi:MAG: LysR family transcriptional regulator [Chthoniobacterales bacterium]|nr:LysR family transcriptional regulator [Chthoniobacterales bacterium]
MQIQTFKVFCDLADTESFSKAAERNGITQSAVSQQVRSIEEQFQVRLIDRGRRAFYLTPEGQTFLASSREIIGAYEELGARMQRLQEVVSGELRIATIFSIGLHELPPYLKRFRREFPLVEVRMDYRRSAQVYAAVQENRADVGLVAYPASRRGITASVFWRDRLVVICAPSHPLAAKRKLSLSDLGGEKFIAFEPDLPTRREVDRRLRLAGARVKVAFEFDNIETVKRAVEIETAISIVPRTSVRTEVETGQLISLEILDIEMWRPLGTLVKKSSAGTPALREFLSLLEKTDLGGEGSDFLPQAEKSRIKK